MLAAAARHGGDFQPSQLKRIQVAREEKLAVLLGALLRRYVEGDAVGFKVRVGGREGAGAVGGWEGGGVAQAWQVKPSCLASWRAGELDGLKQRAWSLCRGLAWLSCPTAYSSRQRCC